MKGKFWIGEWGVDFLPGTTSSTPPPLILTINTGSAIMVNSYDEYIYKSFSGSINFYTRLYPNKKMTQANFFVIHK
jgi:hypothetical protein